MEKSKSVGIAMALLPLFLHSPDNASRCWALRAARAIQAHLSANRRASALPIPLEAPVIITAFSLKVFCILLSLKTW